MLSLAPESMIQEPRVKLLTKHKQDDNLRVLTVD